MLPVAHLAFNAFRHPGRTSSATLSRSTFYVMAGVFAASLLLLFNVPFNFAGVVEHRLLDHDVSVERRVSRV